MHDSGFRGVSRKGTTNKNKSQEVGRGWLQAVTRGVAVAKDMRPVAVVEDQGFTHLINTLESYLVKKTQQPFCLRCKVKFDPASWKSLVQSKLWY